jgi:hypothetical protein
MDDNVFNAKLAWQRACENVNIAVSNVSKTAKAANDDRKDPVYIAALTTFRKATEIEKLTKKIYMSAMAKQNFKRKRTANANGNKPTNE